MQHLGLPWLGLAVLGALATIGPVQATETISLTAVSGYPPTAGWVRDFEGYFVPAVDAALAINGNYQINWNKAFSGQIAKPGEELEAVQNGLADMGLAVVTLETDKVPLYTIQYYTPFTTNNVALESAIMDQLAAKHPEMPALWDAVNQVPLASTGVVDSYQILSKIKIDSLDDLKGAKVGAAGPNQAWVQGLGAVPVAQNMTTAYNDVKTGVYDAMVLHAGAAVNAKLYEVAPYLVLVNFGAAVSFEVTVNKDVWAKLPAEVQDTLRTVAKQYAIVTAKGGELDGVLGKQAYPEHGGTVITVSDDDRRKAAAAMPNFAQAWAAQMDAKGLNGTAILKDYMNAMRAAGEPVMRDWDK